MTDTWNAKTYSQFLDSRTRPARDLLSAIPDSFTPAIVYDLGCGPGNSTALLHHQRWREAEVIGFDSSENMLEEARADWVSGTGLRPILTAMNAENQAQFKEAYLHAVANEYPLQKNGSVLLPFRSSDIHYWH